MPPLAAFLRGINVGGKSLIPMSELKKLLETLGFPNPRTLLNSGNIIFDPGKRSPAAVEKLLETEIAKQFKRDIQVMVRTPNELHDLLATNPFPKEAKEDPSHLLLMFFKNPLTPADVKKLAATIKGPEKAIPRHRHLYLTYPDGIGTSKLTNALIEKTLAQPGTARNWNTLLKLLAALQV